MCGIVSLSWTKKRKNCRVGRAVRDAEALEREIAMLSERYGEAASEARSTGKALREKEALLDAVTNQARPDPK